MSDDQYGQIIRWFEKLSGNVKNLENEVNATRGEIHEIRELMVHLQDDDRVQRQAIANLARRVDSLEVGA